MSSIKPEDPKPETTFSQQPKKKGASFKQAPGFTKYIDSLKNAKESSLDKKDDLLKRLPKSLRYLKPSPMQSFLALLGVSGYFTYKALLCKVIIDPLKLILIAG